MSSETIKVTFSPIQSVRLGMLTAKGQIGKTQKDVVRRAVNFLANCERAGIEFEDFFFRTKLSDPEYYEMRESFRASLRKF